MTRLGLVVLTLLLAVACGKDPSAPPAATYRASIAVTADSSVDSLAVQAADSAFALTAGGYRCVVFPALPSPNAIVSFKVWDNGSYIGEARWNWPLAKYPNITGRAWFDGSQYWARLVPADAECAG